MKMQRISAALIRYLGLICLSATLFCKCAHPQGTYTAASCSQSDVNAVINGPTHTAVDGDKIIIPTTGSPCSWSSGIAITGVGIDITGTGTPNSGGGTVGPGTANTTLIETGSSPFFAFTGLTTANSTAKVELLNFGTTNTSTTIIATVTVVGTCTTSAPYCPSVRIDNITLTANEWTAALAGGGFAFDNVFGVVDHNSMSESPSGAEFLTQDNFDAWQGVGAYGDNSFASADTFGTAQSLFIENNSVSGVRLTENDVSPGNSVGGARWVCRFNTLTNMSGDGLCGAHGTAWGGRFRGERQQEVYYNTVSGSSCNAIDAVLSGTGYFLSNTYTGSGGSGCNTSVSVDIARFIMSGTPWNNCDGTQPWDQSPWSSTTQCLDQPGRGQGAGLENATPVLVSAPGTPCTTAGQCWPNPALDPIYEAGETISGGTPGFGWVAVASDGSQTRILANRDYYAQVSASAQSSATSPFNGSSGTGYGTLANRPTTCTPSVGYWATDTGTWNTYNSSQEGTLYICTSTNTWTARYTPYTYPHPLTTGGTVASDPPNAPSDLTATVE